MEKIKKLFRILLYLSIVFVIYYLYKFDYLIFSSIDIDYTTIAISTILLWLGFIASTLSWQASLKSHNIRIKTNLAIYSHGISVFAKYIPGKIWVILGRASIVSEKGHALITCSTISLKEQLVYLLLGLIISSVTLPLLPINPIFLIIVLATALSLALFLFSKKIHQFSLNTLSKFFRKKIDIPFVGFKQAASYASYILLYWALWSIGFYLLCLAMFNNISILSAFAFPISVCYGLLAVVIPGGIGVRESIIVLFLTAMGLEPSQAIIISIIQRLWFISGEIFIFALAILLKPKK